MPMPVASGISAKAKKSTEAVGFSHGDSGFVVQTLHDAVGEFLFCPELVQDQGAMGA